MNNLDDQFKILIKKILDEGELKKDRTGVGTKSLFGYNMRIKMEDGFPASTLRKIPLKSMIHELLWFLGSFDEKYEKFGNSNLRYILENNCHIWSDWPYKEYRESTLKTYLENDIKEDGSVKKYKLLSLKEFEDKIVKDDDFALKWGSIGRGYGFQWKNWGGYTENIEKTEAYSPVNRYSKNITIINKLGWEKVNFQGINQIDQVIDMLETDPDSRRIIVNAWNVSDIDDMLLPCCHCFFQFYTNKLTEEERFELLKKENVDLSEENLIKYMIPERKLSLQMYQRSCDVFLGSFLNVASYSLLLHMIAQIVNMVPNEFVWTFGDVHLYTNSFEAAKTLLDRESFELPTLKLNKHIDSMYDFRINDILIENYNAHPNIKVDVAV
jgi:thymidylate synthase